MGRPKLHPDRRAYMKAYLAEWRAKNLERHRAAAREHYHANKHAWRERRAEMKAYLDKLKDVSCMDCGLRFPPYVMDFDHRQGEGKLNSVPRMGTSLTLRVIDEAKKCDVVCSNCHRVRTHKRQSRRDRQTA